MAPHTRFLTVPYQRTQRMIISRSKWRPLKSSSMLSTRQLFRSNNQRASYAALTQFAPEPLVKRFDREKTGKGYTKSRMISGLTLLHADEAVGARDRWS